MADETDTTTEAARVIRRMLARALLAAKYDYSIVAESAPSIANALAEDGLLRDEKAIADLGQSIIALLDQVRQLQAQIAASVPAERPQADSGGRGASGGLGERLRALRQRFIGNAGEDDPNNDQDLVITGYTFWAVVQGLEAMAVEVDELETAYRVADAEIARLSVFHDHYRAQVEAIQAAIRREAAHGDAITRCNLVAERFQTVLDGAVGS